MPLHRPDAAGGRHVEHDRQTFAGVVIGAATLVTNEFIEILEREPEMDGVGPPQAPVARTRAARELGNDGLDVEVLVVRQWNVSNARR